MTRKFQPTEAETVKLIEETTRNGRAVTLSFGPSGGWIEWSEDGPIPWEVVKVLEWRGKITPEDAERYLSTAAQ